jgi:hypothetical protein
MKKTSTFLFLFAISTAIFSCKDNNGNINISYKETGHTYSMKADFPESRTKEVDEYMNDKIGSASNMSFTNTRIDGTLALDDHTTFYVKKAPGTLRVSLDKDKNSERSYLEIKSMCDGIKKVLAK